MGPFVQGDTVAVPIEVRDRAGTLTDATTITGAVKAPDASSVTNAVTRTATGTYLLTFDVAQVATATSPYAWAVTATIDDGNGGSFTGVEVGTLTVEENPTL